MILYEKEEAHTSSNHMVATMMVDMMQVLTIPLIALTFYTLTLSPLMVESPHTIDVTLNYCSRML